MAASNQIRDVGRPRLSLTALPLKDNSKKCPGAGMLPSVPRAAVIRLPEIPNRARSECRFWVLSEVTMGLHDGLLAAI
jgi:hypothetical protein